MKNLWLVLSLLFTGCAGTTNGLGTNSAQRKPAQSGIVPVVQTMNCVTDPVDSRHTSAPRELSSVKLSVGITGQKDQITLTNEFGENPVYFPIAREEVALTLNSNKYFMDAAGSEVFELQFLVESSSIQSKDTYGGILSVKVSAEQRARNRPYTYDVICRINASEL